MQQQKMLLGNCSCLELWTLVMWMPEAEAEADRQPWPEFTPGPATDWFCVPVQVAWPPWNFVKHRGGRCRGKKQVLAGPSRCCGSAKGAT